MNPGNAAPRDNGLLQAALDQVAETCWARLPCERVTIMLADGEGHDAVLGIALAWRTGAGSGQCAGEQRQFGGG